PGPRPNPGRPRTAAQSSASTITRLVRNTPAVYPDFSGLLGHKSRLEGELRGITPGALPAFPATPQLTEGFDITFPKIKL
ncbi:MAG: hypothetical protein K8I00_02390, partial [Candidatus Omnitrophica bacterium]|nr:hypothetical protein [Candidatus Omnitrophota bacterium]